MEKRKFMSYLKGCVLLGMLASWCNPVAVSTIVTANSAGCQSSSGNVTVTRWLPSAERRQLRTIGLDTTGTASAARARFPSHSVRVLRLDDTMVPLGEIAR